MSFAFSLLHFSDNVLSIMVYLFIALCVISWHLMQENNINIQRLIHILYNFLLVRKLFSYCSWLSQKGNGLVHSVKHKAS